ncbi:MAG: secondary thiamine-phosphate synthase enzyme YjbQ [Acidobacteriota bacterium]|jgi:secondary thiamine-phosphate synthase enzyme|nr:secondary thiamine-phosphate synthase enzyme YjbQ [Bryobacteraceae bacterium CoA2 C42]MCA2963695.1 YjbQ family protein [Acidobacteriaceae bacterium]
MRQAITSLRVATRGKGLFEITGEVEGWLAKQEVQTGLLTLFIRHTSASLTVQENADPDVIADLNDWFGRLVNEGDPHFRHTLEGPDDMPAHIRSALTAVQVAVPVVNGRLGLGTWQGIYVFEHRRAPHRREVLLHLLGE